MPATDHKLYPATPKQLWLDAFSERAGFVWGWQNIESSARSMAEQAYEESSDAASLEVRLRVERAMWHELVGQLVACHEDNTCPAVSWGKAALADKEA